MKVHTTDKQPVKWNTKVSHKTGNDMVEIEKINSVGYGSKGYEFPCNDVKVAFQFANPGGTSLKCRLTESLS